MRLQNRFIMVREFLGDVLRYSRYLWEVLLFQLFLLIAGGFAISKIEGIELRDAIYFAFVTGFTIGYGDIEPVTGLGRIVSILIGFIGLVFTGLVVAIATRALAETAIRQQEREHAAAEK